jgi:hypothetical protein
MTKHITIELEEDDVAKARVAAEARGMVMEEYLKGLIAAHLPVEAPESRQKILLAKIIGMGSSEHPTDIARDKDKLIGEALWDEHLRETKQE